MPEINIEFRRLQNQFPSPQIRHHTPWTAQYVRECNIVGMFSQVKIWQQNSSEFIRKNTFLMEKEEIAWSIWRFMDLKALKSAETDSAKTSFLVQDKIISMTELRQTD